MFLREVEYNIAHSAIKSFPPNLSEFPLASQVHFQEIVLGPNEYVFIPQRWFHWVTTEPNTLSVSYEFNLPIPEPKIEEGTVILNKPPQMIVNKDNVSLVHLNAEQSEKTSSTTNSTTGCKTCSNNAKNTNDTSIPLKQIELPSEPAPIILYKINETLPSFNGPYKHGSKSPFQNTLSIENGGLVSFENKTIIEKITPVFNKNRLGESDSKKRDPLTETELVKRMMDDQFPIKGTSLHSCNFTLDEFKETNKHHEVDVLYSTTDDMSPVNKSELRISKDKFKQSALLSAIPTLELFPFRYVGYSSTEKVSIDPYRDITKVIGPFTYSSNATFWFSMDKTVDSGLHSDATNNIILVLSGQKRILLAAPHYYKYLYIQSFPMIRNSHKDWNIITSWIKDEEEE